jgi:hypothetical protein
MTLPADAPCEGCQEETQLSTLGTVPLQPSPV